MPRVFAVHGNEDDTNAADENGTDTVDEFQDPQALRQAQTWHGQTSASDDMPGEMIPRASTYPRPIAANLDRHSHSRELDGEPAKKTAKGRRPFDDSTRAKVRKIRKIGSCVRCKMLRKVVSSACVSKAWIKALTVQSVTSPILAHHVPKSKMPGCGSHRVPEYVWQMLYIISPSVSKPTLRLQLHLPSSCSHTFSHPLHLSSSALSTLILAPYTFPPFSPFPPPSHFSPSLIASIIY